MQFPMYEHLKTSILEYRERKGIASGTLLEKGTVTALSAGSATSVAAVITTPIDVVKTRIMLSAAEEGGKQQTQEAKEAMKQVETQGKEAKAEVEKARKVTGGSAGGGKASGFTVGKEIFKNEGVRGLFRGGALRGAWTAFGSGLYLGVYECGRTYLERRRETSLDGNAIS